MQSQFIIIPFKFIFYYVDKHLIGSNNKVTDIPENKVIDIPENKEIDIPENKVIDIPENKVIDIPEITFENGFLQVEPKIIFNKNPDKLICNLRNYKITFLKSAKNIFLCSKNNLDFTIRIENNDIEFYLINGNRQGLIHLATNLMKY